MSALMLMFMPVVLIGLVAFVAAMFIWNGND